MLQTLEARLAEWYKKIPAMPEGSRKGLAGALWWLAALFGILQLWMAWELWDMAHFAGEVDKAADLVNRYYGYTVIDNDLSFFYYASFFVLLASAALYLFAAPGLKAFKKSRGWNLVFYALLVEVVYSLLVIFSDVRGGFDDFLWSLIVAAVAGYFIFQVRDHFKDSNSPVVTERRSETPPVKTKKK